jgi:uncharacterized protein
MAKFDCDWCGKCCRSFGEFIKIERQMTERDYYCRYGVTNEIFPVHVRPEFADDIDEEFTECGLAGDPTRKGCVFMRKNPEGRGFACAVYETRPPVCKEFQCYRMLIHDRPGGELKGKVIGVNELRTGDERLAAIWAEKIAHLPHPFMTRHGSVQHSHAPGANASHGHESLVHAHINGTNRGNDEEWVGTVITVLAAHGYHGDPVE